MRQGKYVARPLADLEAQPFASAEEAWLWYAQCQIARNEGARYRAGNGAVARPCDPDDIYRAVIGLYRSRVIGQNHLSVLGRFGRRLTPPDPWADSHGEAVLWTEALDRLHTVLCGKGIVS